MKLNNIIFAICISAAIFSFSSCSEKGCTDTNACNFNADATKDDGSCAYVQGCTNPDAANYDASAICDDGSCVFGQIYKLQLDYWNTTGTNPTISFDVDESSPEVKIDYTQLFAGASAGTGLSNVVINNVRVLDENNINYEIMDITAYEWRTDLNDWKEDVEFVMDFEQVEELSVVLVLDASFSLGDDFLNVKEFAKDFVNKLFANNPTASVGIVDFAVEINSFPLSSDPAAIFTYIDNIEQGQFTSLYEAMNTGIDMLEMSDKDGKTLLTFTDGTDNNSGPSFTSAYIYDKLTDPASDAIKINSFTIGLNGNGGVDVPVLENLAANGGVAEFPASITELESVFDEFSNSISNVYDLTYIRNQQQISQSDPAQLKFEIFATPK